MNRITILLGASVVSVLIVTGVAPAFAGYGALALDESTLKYGLSGNEVTQAKADEVALKECSSDKCKIVFRTFPRQCGAIATSDDDNVWGGAKRLQRAAAELAALQNCRKRTKAQCKARNVECNR